jgi:septal ring factor EnvC (AmiA/AmiB activator)
MRCGRQRRRRFLSSRFLRSVSVAALVLATSYGAIAQDNTTISRSPLSELKATLLEAQKRSDELKKTLIGYEAEIDRLRTLLTEQDDLYRTLSSRLQQSEIYSNELLQSLRDLRLQYETRIADLERRVRRARIIGGVSSAGSALAGYGLGRLLQ